MINSKFKLIGDIKRHVKEATKKMYYDIKRHTNEIRAIRSKVSKLEKLIKNKLKELEK